MAAENKCTDILAALTRKKTLPSDVMATSLRRCLTTFDLVLMGIGYMVGTGIFVLAGQVAYYDAGPSVIVSFAVAGLVAAMSAACYAEFSSFVPISGSAYTYTYVVVGEMCAFLVGWNVILEDVIGAASAAKSFSGTLDSLCNGSISRAFLETMAIGGSAYISPYPDIVALAAIVLVSVFVLIGAKSSANFSKVMVAIKLLVIAVIIIAGFLLADLDNWTQPDGFFPYGAGGTLSGAATCFFAYVGFDALSTASEETKTPARSLPLATIGSLAIVTVLYVISSMALTSMVPYTDIDPVSPFTSAFRQRGNVWATYVVGVGTMFGLVTVIMSGLFACPRILYSMANDGLVFSFLGRLTASTQTPTISIVLTTFVASLLATFIDLNALVEMLSIGTLFCFTFVAVSIIIVRYTEPVIEIEEEDAKSMTKTDLTKPDLAEDVPLKANSPPSLKNYTDENADQRTQNTTEISERKNFTFIRRMRTALEAFNKSRLVVWSITIMSVGIVSFMLLVVFGLDDIVSCSWWAILLLIVTAVVMIVPLLAISCLEQCPAKDHFQVPLVPLIPAFSIFCNIGLMVMLSWDTWIRLIVWIIVGVILYFAYGIRHSKARHRTVSVYDELEPTEKHVD